MLTGYRDPDSVILKELDDRSLLNLCIANQNLDFCNNESFWKTRTRERFPNAFPYFQDYSFFRQNTILYPEIKNCLKQPKNWKEYYLQTVYYINKLKEEFQFSYQTGNPSVYYAILQCIKMPNVRVELSIKADYRDLLSFLLDKERGPAMLVTVISKATMSGNKEIIEKYLIPELVNLGLRSAVISNNLDLVKYYIEKGANDFVGAKKFAKNSKIIAELDKHL